MCTRGVRAAGSSRLDSVTSISPARASLRYVSDVPHAAQKPRVTDGEEWYSASCPCTIEKFSAAKVPQGTIGAPIARRQLSQWQKHRLLASPWASYRTRPHMQPPR